MRWKKLLMTIAVAVLALSVDGNANRVHAEMAYGGGYDSGCAVLGSPSNDFFCSEWTEEWGDPGSIGGGGSGSGGEPEADRICGQYSGSLCGGTVETTRVVQRCTQWRITNVSGGFTIVGTKPGSIEVGATVTCETMVTQTTHETTVKRWDRR